MIPENDFSYIKYVKLKEELIDKIETKEMDFDKLHLLLYLLECQTDKIKWLEENLYGKDSNTEIRGSNDTCDC